MSVDKELETSCDNDRWTVKTRITVTKNGKKDVLAELCETISQEAFEAIKAHHGAWKS
jgi:hypothetical protein